MCCNDDGMSISYSYGKWGKLIWNCQSQGYKILYLVGEEYWVDWIMTGKDLILENLKIKINENFGKKITNSKILSIKNLRKCEIIFCKF
jgi:hypothetical protein